MGSLAPPNPFSSGGGGLLPSLPGLPGLPGGSGLPGLPGVPGLPGAGGQPAPTWNGDEAISGLGDRLEGAMDSGFGQTNETLNSGFDDLAGNQRAQYEQDAANAAMQGQLGLNQLRLLGEVVGGQRDQTGALGQLSQQQQQAAQQQQQQTQQFAQQQSQADRDQRNLMQQQVTGLGDINSALDQQEQEQRRLALGY